MGNDLVQGTYRHHPFSLGPVLALRLTEGARCRAYAIDPPSTDEFSELARISGIPEIQRTSAFHALSHKAVGYRAAAELGKSYDQCRLVVAHLGGSKGDKLAALVYESMAYQAAKDIAAMAAVLAGKVDAAGTTPMSINLKNMSTMSLIFSIDITIDNSFPRRKPDHE